MLAKTRQAFGVAHTMPDTQHVFNEAPKRLIGVNKMKTRDELDEMLAVDVLSDPFIRDGLNPHQLQVVDVWAQAMQRQARHP